MEADLRAEPRRATATRAARKPGLDTVRGLALVAVVAYHLRYLEGGFLGVDVFFVLSGYLLTGLALEEIASDGRLSLRHFWGRRARRLAPALFLAVPIVIAVALWSGWPATARHGLAWDGIATMTWWQNWRMILSPGGGYWEGIPSLFRHAWSLSIEEQFYALWPLLACGAVRLARRTNRSVRSSVGLVAAVGALLSFAQQVNLQMVLSSESLNRYYLGSDSRAFGPLVGCFTACVFWGRDLSRGLRRVLSVLAGVSVVALGYLMATSSVAGWGTYRHGVFPIVAVLSAVVIVASSTVTFAEPITTWLGRHSYALYVWSWPVQLLAENQWPLASRTRLTVIVVAVTLVAAAVSMRVLERPVLTRRGWAGSSRRLAGVGLAALLVVSGVMGATFATAEPPLAHERLNAAAALAYEMGDGIDQIDPASGEKRGSGVGKGTERVLLIGDSVAFTMGWYLYGHVPDELRTVTMRAALGCGLLSGLGYQWQDQAGFWIDPGEGLCAKASKAVYEAIDRKPSVLLVEAGSWEAFAVRSPAGRVIQPMTRTMSTLLTDRILDLAARAHRVGARTVLIEWSCPGPRHVLPAIRAVSYIRWLNDVMHDAASEGRRRGYEMAVLAPNDKVCVGGRADGSPTKAMLDATSGGIHVTSVGGARWLWDEWLGPGIAATKP